MKSTVSDFLLMSIMSDLILVGLSAFDFGAATTSSQFAKNKISQQKIMKKIARNFDLKRFTFVIFICVAVVFIILRAPQSIDAKEILEFNRDPQNYNVKLQVLDSDAKMVAEFSTAIADSPEHKMYGLMNLDQLPQNFGMLFPFKKSQVILMWMKNTRISLDMVFIDEDGVVVSVKTNTQPFSLDIISSEKEAKKVLEINGGLAKKFGIEVGQKVKY